MRTERAPVDYADEFDEFEDDEDDSGNFVSALLPKTLVGLSMWILMFAAGMAASGVALYAYYQHKLNVIEQSTQQAREELNTEFKAKSKELNELVKSSKAEIEKASRGVGTQTNEITALLEKVGPSIAYVAGTDAAGGPGVGSGFVVTSNGNESWIITTFRNVAGSAAAKAPVQVRVNNTSREATVWSWDERRDLALLIVKAGNLPVIEWAGGQPPIGSVVWTLGTASGKFAATAAQGHLVDASGDGLLIDTGIPVSSAGGPVLTREGKVIGVLSVSYAPEGLPPSPGWAVPIRLSCQRVLKCPS